MSYFIDKAINTDVIYSALPWHSLNGPRTIEMNLACLPWESSQGCVLDHKLFNTSINIPEEK